MMHGRKNIKLTTVIEMATGSNHIYIVHTCFSWQQITLVVMDFVIC